VLGGHDSLCGRLDEAPSELAGDGLERTLLRRLVREGLFHCEGLVREVGFRRNESERDSIAGKITKRHQRLQPRNSTADNDDVSWIGSLEYLFDA